MSAPYPAGAAVVYRERWPASVVWSDAAGAYVRTAQGSAIYATCDQIHPGEAEPA